MENHSKVPLHHKCMDCGEQARLVAWFPPRGLDPYLRQYDCSWCGSSFYQIVKLPLELAQQLSFLKIE